MADLPSGAGPQDDCRLSQKQWNCDPQGMFAVCRPVPRDWAFVDGERCNRWLQVQGGQQPGPELYQAKMARRMEQIEESVERYLHQLDSADRQEPSEATTSRAVRLSDKIAKLKEEMQRLKA